MGRNIDLIKGAKVKIVNYGSINEVRKELISDTPTFLKDNIIIWENKNSYFIDLNPELIGKDGLIYADKIGRYAIFFDETINENIGYHVSYWYNPEQVEYQGTIEVDERMNQNDAHHLAIYGDGTYL